MKIDVTQEDIDNGVPRCRVNCAIAIALRRQVQGCSFVAVDEDLISVIMNDKLSATWSTPDIAADFIRHFDIKAIVEPISFELEFDDTCRVDEP